MCTECAKRENCKGCLVRDDCVAHDYFCDEALCDGCFDPDELLGCNDKCITGAYFGFMACVGCFKKEG